MSEAILEIYAAKIVSLGHVEEWYEVGKCGVTQIIKTAKAGVCNDIPYIQIWKSENIYAEFCQHNIVGIYFKD